MDNIEAVRQVFKEKHSQHETQLDITKPDSPHYPSIFTQTIYSRGQLDLFNQLYPEVETERPEPMLIK